MSNLDKNLGFTLDYQCHKPKKMFNKIMTFLLSLSKIYGSTSTISAEFFRIIYLIFKLMQIYVRSKKPFLNTIKINFTQVKIYENIESNFSMFSNQKSYYRVGHWVHTGAQCIFKIKYNSRLTQEISIISFQVHLMLDDYKEGRI